MLDDVDGGLLVFVSPDCETCDEAVDRLSTWPLDARRRSRLVFWGQPRDDFVAPAGVRILADASDLYTDLGVTRTPWYLEVADGAVQRQGLGLPARRGRRNRRRESARDPGHRPAAARLRRGPATCGRARRGVR